MPKNIAPVKEKKIFVIDHTGKNAYCYECKTVVGRKNLTVFHNHSLCKACIDKYKAKVVEHEQQQEIIKQKIRKRGRTLTKYISETFETHPGQPYSTEDLAKMAIADGVVKQTDVEKVKCTISVTISILRKKKFMPLEKVGRGRYQMRKV